MCARSRRLARHDPPEPCDGLATILPWSGARRIPSTLRVSSQVHVTYGQRPRPFCGALARTLQNLYSRITFIRVPRMVMPSSGGPVSVVPSRVRESLAAVAVNVSSSER